MPSPSPRCRIFRPPSPPPAIGGPACGPPRSYGHSICPAIPPSPFRWRRPAACPWGSSWSGAFMRMKPCARWLARWLSIYKSLPARRPLQLPGLVDEICMNGFNVRRGQYVVKARHSLGHVGAAEHDGAEQCMRPGLHASQVREIAPAHDMTSRTKPIVEDLACGDLRSIGGLPGIG